MEVLHQAFNTDTQSDTSSTSPEDNINVVVRVRPLNEKEKKNRDEMVAQFPGNGQILVKYIKYIHNNYCLIKQFVV